MPAEAERTSPARTHLLILGGTEQARAAARELAAAGFRVTFSLAGLTETPRRPPGAQARTGGFGGAEGLARWIAANDVAMIVDATHPFAARMGRNALRAAEATGVALIRLERPPWRPEPGDRWLEVSSPEAAAALLPREARVFAALGGRGLAALAGRRDLWLTARMAGPAAFALPPRWRLVRGAPFASAAREAALLRAVRARWLVCRNSGGRAGRAKLRAARALGLPVIMAAPPERPRTRTARSVEELIRRVCATF